VAMEDLRMERVVKKIFGMGEKEETDGDDSQLFKTKDHMSPTQQDIEEASTSTSSSGTTLRDRSKKD